MGTGIPQVASALDQFSQDPSKARSGKPEKNSAEYPLFPYPLLTKCPEAVHMHAYKRKRERLLLEISTAKTWKERASGALDELLTSIAPKMKTLRSSSPDPRTCISVSVVPLESCKVMSRVTRSCKQQPCKRPIEREGAAKRKKDVLQNRDSDDDIRGNSENKISNMEVNGNSCDDGASRISR